MLCVCRVTSGASGSVPPHGLWPARPLCPRASPGKNIAVGCCALLQGIFPTQGLSPSHFCLLHWQAGSLRLTKARENSSLEQLNEIAPPHSHCIFFFWTSFYVAKTVIASSRRRRSIHNINKRLVTEPSKILRRIRQILPIMQSHF